MRFVAVDWSGATRGGQSIHWAEVENGSVERSVGGLPRGEVVRQLTDAATRDPDLVVGLDFAFSLPAWFLDDQGLDTARDLWRRVDRCGEQWLQNCPKPFWGRDGSGKPDLPAHYRRTEQEARELTGLQPSSPFKLVGPGQVGTGSLRGMPHLSDLDEAGFHIWPFDPPARPLVVEIYPRLLTGSVTKSSPQARRRYLHDEHPDLDADAQLAAASDPNAFDAIVSALVMDRNGDQFRTLQQLDDRVRKREGMIWWPNQ